MPIDAPICKKHKRFKDQVWREKQEHGGYLTRTGCIECKALEANKVRPAKRQTRVKSFVRRWLD
jgi:hypothetical protein